MKFTAEQIAKMKAATSAEELIALAKAEGIEASEDEIKAQFDAMHKEGEIADEELDNVAGGTCYSSGVKGPLGKQRSYAIVSPLNICPYSKQTCINCEQSFTIDGTWYCEARWKTEDGEVFDTSYFGKTH